MNWQDWWVNNPLEVVEAPVEVFPSLKYMTVALTNGERHHFYLDTTSAEIDEDTGMLRMINVDDNQVVGYYPHDQWSYLYCWETDGDPRHLHPKGFLSP